MSKQKTEVKCAIAPADAETALKAVGLATQEFEGGQVWFFDDMEKRLLAAGIILRARRSGQGPVELTLKLRGEACGLIDWEAIQTTAKVKPERDWTVGGAHLPSVSVTWTDVRRFEDVIGGLAHVSTLASEPEIVRDVLASVHDHGVLALYGGIPTRARKHLALAGVSDVAVEAWDLPALTLVELSAKIDDAAKATEVAFLDWCALAGVSPLGSSKTSFALDHLEPATLAP